MRLRLMNLALRYNLRFLQGFGMTAGQRPPIPE
jgi:hypothetical protein